MHVDMYMFTRHTHKCKVDICSGVEKKQEQKSQTDKTKQNKNKKDKGKNK